MTPEEVAAAVFGGKTKLLHPEGTEERFIDALAREFRNQRWQNELLRPLELEPTDRLEDRLDAVEARLVEIVQRPPLSIDQAMLEAALRTVLGSVDNTPTP